MKNSTATSVRWTIRGLKSRFRVSHLESTSPISNWVNPGKGCTPMEPTVAGPSARKNLRTSASSLGQLSVGKAPARQALPPTSNTCSTPEIKTPQAAA